MYWIVYREIFIIYCMGIHFDLNYALHSSNEYLNKFNIYPSLWFTVSSISLFFSFLSFEYLLVWILSVCVCVWAHNWNETIEGKKRRKLKRVEFWSISADNKSRRFWIGAQKPNDCFFVLKMYNFTSDTEIKMGDKVGQKSWSHISSFRTTLVATFRRMIISLTYRISVLFEICNCTRSNYSVKTGKNINRCKDF